MPGLGPPRLPRKPEARSGTESPKPGSNSAWAEGLTKRGQDAEGEVAERTELRKILDVVEYDRKIAKVTRVHYYCVKADAWGGQASLCTSEARRHIPPRSPTYVEVDRKVDREQDSAQAGRLSRGRGHDPRSGAQVGGPHRPVTVLAQALTIRSGIIADRGWRGEKRRIRGGGYWGLAVSKCETSRPGSTSPRIEDSSKWCSSGTCRLGGGQGRPGKHAGSSRRGVGDRFRDGSRDTEPEPPDPAQLAEATRLVAEGRGDELVRIPNRPFAS